MDEGIPKAGKSIGEVGKSNDLEGISGHSPVEIAGIISWASKALGGQKTPADSLALIAALSGWGTTLRYALLIAIRSSPLFLVAILVLNIFNA